MTGKKITLEELVAGAQYRVTRDDNRPHEYSYGLADAYVGSGAIVTVTRAQPDGEGEVSIAYDLADNKKRWRSTEGWISPDALEPYPAPEPPTASIEIDEKVLRAAMSLHEMDDIKVTVLRDLIETYNKIKAALA